MGDSARNPERSVLSDRALEGSLLFGHRPAKPPKPAGGGLVGYRSAAVCHPVSCPQPGFALAADSGRDDHLVRPTLRSGPHRRLAPYRSAALPARPAILAGQVPSERSAGRPRSGFVGTGILPG